MTRVPDPQERLTPYLNVGAAAWGRILGVDTTAHAILGRVAALSLYWMALHREALQSLGINYAELSVLATLRISEPAHRRSPTELRALIGQSSAGMTRILDKLEADGHLSREDIEGDRRRLDIALTPSGAELAERGFAALLALENDVMDGAAPEDRAAIARSLDALLAAFAGRPR